MDQHDNKESSLIVDTPQPPELPTQPQRRRPSLFFLQMNETDGIIVVEVGLCGHFRAMDDDESGNIHHHYFLSQHGSFDRSCLETSSSSSRCRAPQCQIRRNLLARLQHCRTRVLYLHFVPRTDLFIIQKDLFITNNAVALSLSSSTKRYFISCQAKVEAKPTTIFVCLPHQTLAQATGLPVVSRHYFQNNYLLFLPGQRSDPLPMQSVLTTKDIRYIRR